MSFIDRAFQTLPAQSTQVYLSFFFHGRGTTLQKNDEGMFCSLLYQFYHMSPPARRVILNAFEEKSGFGEAGRGWRWRAQELESLFSGVVREAAQWQEVTIFVDALDEDGSKTAAELVTYFHRLNGSLIAAGPGSSAKICISCRHYPVTARSPGLDILVYDENGHDIRSFVRWKLEEVSVPPDYSLFIEKRKDLGECCCGESWR